MRLRNISVGLLGMALATTLACGGSQETSSKSAEPSSPAAAGAGQKVDKATGAARYADDLSFPGMLYGRTIRS